MASRRRPALVPVEHISRSILILRGQRVILDSHLAAIYGVTTGRLNEAVKRAKRFPEVSCSSSAGTRLNVQDRILRS